MRHLTRLVIAAALVACALPRSAQALVFDPVSAELSRGRAVLWIRDCGRLGDGPCRGPRGFTAGDSLRLRRALGDARYEEVWMWSGGGDLVEGIRIGHVLREWQATVRVPPGAVCASACTVAFLGGLFRYVEAGGSYEVHAASGFLHGFQGESRTLLNQLLGGSERETAEALLRFTGEEYRGVPDGCAIAVERGTVQRCSPGTRGYAAALFALFQRAVLPLDEAAGSGPAVSRWLNGGGTPVPYPREQLAEDIARIRREGEPAAQEILMRLERDAMAHAIAELRAIAPSLGPRARPALAMLEVMYSKRIAGGAADVSPATLVQMGYVTPTFNPAGR